jgi:hypothetical protein
MATAMSLTTCLDSPGNMQNPKPLSWKARRRGPIYCASACGGGCTWDQYQEAKRRAAALCLKLGINWVPDVYENLGWHYRAKSKCGRLAVYVDRKGLCACFFNAAERQPAGRWIGRSKNPKQAVKSAILLAQNERNEITLLLKDLE